MIRLIFCLLLVATAIARAESGIDPNLIRLHQLAHEAQSDALLRAIGELRPPRVGFDAVGDGLFSPPRQNAAPAGFGESDLANLADRMEQIDLAYEAVQRDRSYSNQIRLERTIRDMKAEMKAARLKFRAGCVSPSPASSPASSAHHAEPSTGGAGGAFRFSK